MAQSPLSPDPARRRAAFVASADRRRTAARRRGPYAALDLGTNNCRLLVARPTADGFRVIDAFSRIVRLGEGLSQTGRLSEAAIERTLEALRVCRDKMAARGVTRARLIATEACRAAENGAEFLERVRERARAQAGDRRPRDRGDVWPSPAAANSPTATPQSIVLFDIGGGSSEIIWLEPRRARRRRPSAGMRGVGVAAARRRVARREIRRRRRHARRLSPR